MNINILDIETLFDSKQYTLSKMGSIEYARDPRAECQMIGVSVNGGPAHIYEKVPERLAQFDMEHDTRVG